MSELLYCPFCGASPEIITDRYGTRGILEHKPDCLWYFSNFPKHMIPEQDFEKWNTRYEHTCYSERTDCFECSGCGFLDAYAAPDAFRFCPHCGARVTEE